MNPSPLGVFAGMVFIIGFVFFIGLVGMALGNALFEVQEWLDEEDHK